MKFPRSKKLLFANNKGGVGKTTLAYNAAVSFAKEGYKTVLVDLDPNLIDEIQMGTKENIEKSRKSLPTSQMKFFKFLRLIKQ